MTLSNFERLIQLADTVFDVKNDPDQLDINPEVMERLQKMHPATISEYNDGNGPVAWVLVIPTTFELMNRFIDNQISEKELFYLTPLDITYEALYLCSALVLEEFRRKGIAKRLTLRAIESVCQRHPIKALFVWAFSREGDLGAETIAHISSLPLYKRSEHQ